MNRLEFEKFAKKFCETVLAECDHPDAEASGLGSLASTLLSDLVNGVEQWVIGGYPPRPTLWARYVVELSVKIDPKLSKSEFLSYACELMRKKNAEYNSEDDVLDSFSRLADILVVDQYQIWFILASKHLHALRRMANRAFMITNGFGATVHCAHLIGFFALLSLMVNEE